jgi:hypothetical protein
MGGLFIETDKPKVPGITAKLHFLVQEGQIRADAVVRHAKPGRGLGLRFTAVHNEDRPRLAELMKRLRRSSWSPHGNIASVCHRKQIAVEVWFQPVG